MPLVADPTLCLGCADPLPDDRHYFCPRCVRTKTAPTRPPRKRHYGYGAPLVADGELEVCPCCGLSLPSPGAPCDICEDYGAA